MDEPLDMNKLGKGRKGPWDKQLKLVSENGELLLECRIGDEYHQLLLEVGLNTILEKFIKEGNLGSLKELDCEGIDISAEKGKVNIVDIPGFEGTMDELDNLVNK